MSSIGRRGEPGHRRAEEEEWSRATSGDERGRHWRQRSTVTRPMRPNANAKVEGSSDAVAEADASARSRLVASSTGEQDASALASGSPSRSAAQPDAAIPARRLLRLVPRHGGAALPRL
jgi:hypothetical protein